MTPLAYLAELAKLVPDNRGLLVTHEVRGPFLVITTHIHRSPKPCITVERSELLSKLEQMVEPLEMLDLWTAETLKNIRDLLTREAQDELKALRGAGGKPDLKLVQ